MDVQLKELIDKIKNDGVKSAEENSKRIITEAEEKAKQIIKDAEKKANDLKDSSTKAAELAKQSGVDAVKQAARDLVIDLKKEIETIFDKFIKEETGAALKGDALGAAVNTVLGNWDKDTVANIEVLLPESDLETVKKALQSKLGDALKKGLELKPGNNVDAGFKISEKDGNVYYDFTAEGVGEMMSSYLSPQLSQFVKGVKED